MSGHIAAKVLVVEDDPDTQTILRLGLSDAGFEVATAEDALNGCERGREFQPDAALLDVRLAGMSDGYMVARQLRAVSDVPILFLSANTGLEARLLGFEVGADDYIPKPFAMPEVIARLQAVLERSGKWRARMWEVGDLVVDEDEYRVTRGGAQVRLTPTEFALLVALCRRQGRVATKTQLLEEVWGFEGYGSSVVEVRLSDLRRKLEEHGPRLVHTVRGVGYVLRAQEASPEADQVIDLRRSDGVMSG